MKKLTYVLSAMLMLAATPTQSRAADEQWQVGTAPSFSSGRYGTDTRTEVFHTPITARRLFTSGDLTLVFPFTCIRGNGAVTVVNGTPVRTEASGTMSARTGGTTTDGRTGASAGTSRTTTDAALQSDTGALAPAATNCGMGDIIVRGRYYLLDEREWWPTIAVRAHVKTPTANAETGLGTGRPDEGIGIEVSRTLAGGLMAMVDGGYTVIGRPAGVDFDNNWWYDVGLGQDLADGVVNLSVFFEEYRAIVPGLANARDVLAAVTIKGTNGWRLQISGEFGLSDGAPDHGVTFGASRRF